MHASCQGPLVAFALIFLLARGNVATSPPSHAQLLDLNIAELCINKCRSQTHTDLSQCDDPTFCDQKCEEGCKLWKSAVETSCEKACNVTTTIVPKTLYCMVGCNYAIFLYGQELQSRLGDLPAPALVADSLTATSLRLEWNFPLAHDAGLKYFLQYEEREDAWQYCRNQSWGPQDTVFVDNLEPYTKYRFRVVLLLTERTDPIVSPPSVVISTLPDGVPASPPSKVRAVPVDSTRITVSWEPGPFPHGPLLSYVLRITDNQPNGYSALKDLPAETKFFMCKNLNPNSNYTVSISMRNGIGPGPPAIVTVATPKQPKAKHSEKPMLVLGGNHVVIEQGTELIDDAVILYNTVNNAFVMGVAIHIRKKLLFVSDSDRNVYRMRRYREDNKDSSITKIISAAQIDFLPLDLSMDWLNEHLYILGEVSRQDGKRAWQIARCNLTGGELTIAIAGLLQKPTHFEVDPYNGYLFWGMASGIYRLDLADVSNGIKHEVKPFKITGEKNLGAFIVDHEDFKILVAHQTKNTVISISFDGKEVMNMRPKTTRPRFEKVVSLATANDILYWTNGVDIYFEEHHPDNNYYFHNTYPLSLSKTYSQVLVNLTSSQSIPIPLNPPINVEAVFGTTSARISWQVPHILGWQGKGAWRNWSYDISIKDMTTHNTCYARDINSTSYTIHGLEEDTEYVIKTLAYTVSGNGPWSTEFIGRTLKSNKDNTTATILWSGTEGLLQSDVTGDNIETIIHSSSNIGANVTDIAWYEDKLFLVTNTSQLIWYNTTSHENGTLSDIDSVRSVSIDWVGKKLYWCNPKQQMIIRGNFNGSQKEHIKLNTLAKELHVDSINGYLYWSTGHTLECSRLNGENHFKYHESQMFSGLHVMGLTLDMDHNYIYWIVRGSDHSDLFKAPMAGTVDNPLVNVTEYKLRVYNLTGPLCYFNNRLIWLQDDKSAMISDLEGRNTACIRGKSLLNLNTVYVKDSALHSMPNNNLTDVEFIVIPGAISRSSVKIVGTWDSFHIEWEQVTNVNYGAVFYEIKVDTASRNDSTKKATIPSIKYWHSIAPYTNLHITVRAYTYWGASVYTKVKLHSPPSVPQAPRHPRAFVTHDYRSSNTSQVNVTYRWDAPEVTNGVLLGYHIVWSSTEDDGNFTVDLDNLTVEAGVRELVVRNLLPFNYTFKVSAFTEIGEGNFCESIIVDTTIEKPIPKILVAASNTIYLKDMDTFTNTTLIQGGRSPIQIGYLYAEQKIFWINDINELAMLNFSRMVEISGNLVHLTVDWLERSVYYLVYNKGFSTIFKLDLNLYERGIVKNIKIVELQEEITRIEISPFERMLYWLQWNKNKAEGHIYRASVEGKRLSKFVHTRSSCDCPKITGHTFTVDRSLKYDTKLVYLSVDQLISTADGCRCTVLSKNMPADIKSITADFNNVFWSEKKLHMLSLMSKHHKMYVENTMVNDVVIYGPTSQPYPRLECLKPSNIPEMKVSMVKRSSNTLTLKMPDYPSPCNTTMATVEYIIYYSAYNMMSGPPSCDETCTQKTTFDTTTDIINLRPYTKYVVAVTLRNFFSDQDGDDIVIGPGVVYQTEAGAPTPPQNVRVDVLNPTLLSVRWEPPAALNGDFVYYEVHWQTEGAISGVRHKGEQTVMNPLHSAVLTTKLQAVSPNETYSIWIRAYSQTNETSSDSKHVTITTFPQPESIRLIENSATELRVQWNVSRFVDSFVIQYTLLTSTLWEDIKNIDINDGVADVVLKDLKPKTPYKFRLSLKYPLDNENYIYPKDTRFAFETLGDRPSPPGIPRVQHVKNDVYKVWWEPSKDNGAPIIMYNLETLKLPNYRSKRNANRTAWFNTPYIEEADELLWESIYNGTDSFWMFSDMQDDYRYSFRVCAVNSYGWSNYSEESLQFDMAVAAQMAKNNDLVRVFIPVGVTFCIIIVLLITCKICCGICSKSKKEGIKIPLRGPDVELATLRELPRILNNTNILYNPNQIPDDISMLPHISRDKITLVKFLGSGAFGEVFQGKAKGLTVLEGETKVAVKTLRKGASDTEKFEFLQEAQLMSHFKHEHILELLGVVLDNDPHYIIMELMEGGDLLTYLRSSRKPESNVGSLNLLDLLKMCVDVSKGCRYLEEMHFVHRDLACRNCLVSSTDPSARIVKIGDFGLARDIYKNDYYRKEGEGLLPVRWMAPESLVDGVFTCQSDVWAFGVLLWEIMTLGQQPYPARNNLEVLHYVRRGGRLGQPTNCPEVLHSLMLKCWETEPERRPTFKYCLDTLERLHLKMAGSPMTGAHIGQYVSTVSAHLDGISNRAYFQDENHNHSANSIISGSEEETSREQVPFLRSNSTLPAHTYLDILQDSDSAIENDGYEVPRTVPFEVVPSVPTECDKFKQVVNDLTMIEHLLKPDTSVEYTNMNTEQKSHK